MARLHTKILHWGNKHDGPNNYKMGREGALEDALWDEDELVDYIKATRGQKKNRPKKMPGCPGNDNGPHVYVWVPYADDWFFHNGKYEIKVCCGCYKRAGRGFRVKSN